MKEASETNEGTKQCSRAGNDGGRQTADGRMSERTKVRKGKKEREINDASAMGPKERTITNE